MPGMSENISVRSVIGRYLEHSRIFYFRNGAAQPEEGEFFMGSADWMYRNLNARVEAIVPIEESKLRAKCWRILELLLNDERQGWEMRPDGNYIQKGSSATPNSAGVHETLMRLARDKEHLKKITMDQMAKVVPIEPLREGPPVFH